MADNDSILDREIIALRAEIDAIRDDTVRTAEAGCELADLGIGWVTPDRLQSAQDGLRGQIKWVEARLRETRAGTRPVFPSPIDGENRARYGERREEHRRLLALRDDQLRLQRLVLRQIGDTHAWIVLCQDPRVIQPLHSEQTAHLPDGVGLAGVVALAMKAHQSGNFFVIENDLTRCIGIGDLTVVPVGVRWRVPLSVEVKASGNVADGEQVGIGATIPVSENADHKSLFEEFCRTVGLAPVPEDVRVASKEKQIATLTSRSELLLTTLSRPGTELRGPSSQMWRAVDAVLSDALEVGQASRTVEPGVTVIAVRLTGDYETRLRALVAQTREAAPLEHQEVLTSEDLLRAEALSSIVPPIPLWPIARAARNALLSRELHFGVVMTAHVWPRAFAEAGLRLHEVGDGWLVEGPTAGAPVDALEVRS